jgi:hypothetical protein
MNDADTGSDVDSGFIGDAARTYRGPATIHGSRPTTASVSASGTPRGCN